MSKINQRGKKGRPSLTPCQQVIIHSCNCPMHQDAAEQSLPHHYRYNHGWQISEADTIARLSALDVIYRYFPPLHAWVSFADWQWNMSGSVGWHNFNNGTFIKWIIPHSFPSFCPFILFSWTRDGRQKRGMEGRGEGWRGGGGGGESFMHILLLYFHLFTTHRCLST